MFNLQLLDLPKLSRIDGEVRLYETPTGERYPSVTTILGEMSDKTHLDAWRKRIGGEEANKISRRSANRGTAMHKMLESLVMNEKVDTSNAMPLNLHLYRQVEKLLVENVDNIRCSEASLFSHYLRSAGTVDLCADWKGRPAIIDFKTSGKYKKREWIENYFMQASIYAFMLYEMTKIHCPDIVIIIGVEEENEAQVFEAKAVDYIDKARSICRAYHEKMA